MKYQRTEDAPNKERGDSPHAIYSDDLLRRHNAELHRFRNAAGVPYSAIYRSGFEEMSAPRVDEGIMLIMFKRRLYVEKTGREWV